MRCFVVAEFLLTSASRGPSAIAEFLVNIVIGLGSDWLSKVKKQKTDSFRLGRSEAKRLEKK